MKTLILPICLYLFTSGLHAQATIEMNEEGHYYFDNFLPYSAYSSWINRNGEPYLYSACRELGIVTFDISDVDAPVPVDTIPTSALNNLIPNNITQNGNYLYVATGGYNLIPQKAGIAILDITNPAAPVVTDTWDSTAFNQGCAIVISDGAYAYLGGMDDGLIITDVSDKHHISFVSSILPDPNYPEVPDLFSTPNVRGMAFYGPDTLMVAYDAGGLRMIDISDKSSPLEIGKYADPDIESIAQSAYNNIAIKDHYAYITVDMCGLLVVDIASSDMTTVDWFNPWECDSTNWDGRPGHTNDLRIYDNSVLFVSGGDSELLVFDITNPASPVQIGVYGAVLDSVVSWGLDAFDNKLSLALIDNSFVGFPYYSNVGGVQLISFEVTTVGISQTLHSSQLQLYPNPADEIIFISGIDGKGYFMVNDSKGILYKSGAIEAGGINCSELPQGIYIIRTFDEDMKITGSAKMMIMHQD